MLSSNNTEHSIVFKPLRKRAQTVHREYFDPNKVALATLLSVKTGGCPEDYGYCPQSVNFDVGVEATKLMGVVAVCKATQRAKASGATRSCMGAAWRAPKDRNIDAAARVRLSAGHQEMDEALRLLYFLAGANSIFYGEKLLTTGNPDVEIDRSLLARLGITIGQ